MQPTRLLHPWDFPGKSTGVGDIVFPETNLDSILKSRDIALSTKVRLVNAMVFPVGMYECESWTIEKAEYRLLRVPWTARRSNQSILKETSPGCSLEGLMLKLKL